MDKITDCNKVFKNIDKMYKNMLTEGTWKHTSEKVTNIRVLVTKLDKTNKKLKETKQQLEDVKGNDPQEERGKKGKGGSVAKLSTISVQCKPRKVKHLPQGKRQVHMTPLSQIKGLRSQWDAYETYP